VEADRLDAFEARMGRVYRDQLHTEPAIHVCRLRGGTELLDPETASC